jgi:hypothetical protein
MKDERSKELTGMDRDCQDKSRYQDKNYSGLQLDVASAAQQQVSTA